VQTLFWFSATIVGVALLSGRILEWPRVDQLVAAGVLAGIGWLVYRGAR
jgi:divalent metal cation (Fe/Co/Zn/Cd) transporter